MDIGAYKVHSPLYWHPILDKAEFISFGGIILNLGMNKRAITPCVSIIMTTYNVEEHIEESLRSVLSQDIGDLEVLCVDGRSKDGTLDIINGFAEKDPRVRLIFQDRPGIGAAKNCGIENARGKYITFLDADDFYVDKTALRKMYQVCESEQVKVCGAFRSTLFMDGRIENEPLHRHDCKEGMPPVRLQYRDRQYDYHFHSYLYDRDMIINSDARFAEVTAYDDTHFFIRAMLAAEEFCVVPVELYRYRCGPAYDWGMERANDAILTLTDQLKLTREQGLSTLHWIALQRINYEYGGIFEKNVLAGDYELLERLIAANAEIDANMIREVEANPPNEHWYLEPMMHRRRRDMPLRQGENPYAPPYIIEPLWRVMHPDCCRALQDENNRLKHRINELEAMIPQVDVPEPKQSSYLLRKIRGGIRCYQEHGFRYTIRRFFQKICNVRKR